MTRNFTMTRTPTHVILHNLKTIKGRLLYHQNNCITTIKKKRNKKFRHHETLIVKNPITKEHYKQLIYVNMTCVLRHYNKLILV